MKINEIFDSLSGECDGFGGQGKPTTFIRLQGCNFLPAGCSYCDTQQARFEGGTEMTVDEIVQQVNMPKVIITGGEPLVQYEEVEELVKRLFKLRLSTTIETNGSICMRYDFPGMYGRGSWLRIVMDYKLPSSGMEKYMNDPAFALLRSWDIIKFVIKDTVDYVRMKELLTNRSWEAQIAISPVLSASPGDLITSCNEARTLAQKVIDDPDLKHACFNLQLHKLLGIR